MIVAKDWDDPLQSVTFGAMTGPESMLGAEEKKRWHCQAKQVEEKEENRKCVYLMQAWGFEEVYRAWLRGVTRLK